MKLSFFGGTKVVTGTNYLLETKKSKILVDCGLFYNPLLKEKNEKPFLYSPQKINAVILTHAHLDHTGRLPKLVREGFKGKVFATPATLNLTKLILEDALEVQEEIIFSKEDLKNTLSLFCPIEYHQKRKISPDISFNLLDAGHILGSAIVEVFVKEKKNIKIVFSGDLGNPPTPLLRPTELPDFADYILIESTYGDKIHQDFLKRKEILEDTIEKTIKEKGVLLIPSFSIERTHELLYELNELVENQRIPKIPIFIDSPLTIKSLKIYKKYKRYYNREAAYLLKSGDEIFKFPGLIFTKKREDSKKIKNVPPPKIIIAGSGMSEGGRILYHEREYLPLPQTCILFICYQVKGTRGRKIQNRAKEVEIFGKMVPVRAKIKTIQGYSAHADKDILFRWVYHIKSTNMTLYKKPVKKVFVVQGEKRAAKSFAQLIMDHLGIETKMPEYGESFKL